MFQRIHLSGLLSVTARCVKGELGVLTGISGLTSISTPLVAEAFSVSLMMCVLFARTCMCVPKCIPPQGLGWSIYHPRHHQCAVLEKENGRFHFLQTCSVLSVRSSQISMTYENSEGVEERRRQEQRGEVH